MIGPTLTQHGPDVPVSTLAYIGDAVYELYARLYACKHCQGRSGQLHRHSVELVKAQAQAKAVRRVMPLLTPEERLVFRRGRNSQPNSRSKHASLADYLSATGLEAVIGYLSLKQEEQRLDELMAVILEEHTDEPGT